MKFVVCVIAAFAALQYVSCYLPVEDSYEPSQELDQYSMTMLRNSIRQRAALEQLKSKVNAICPGYGYRLENITKEIETCADLIDESEETMCSIVKNHMKRCLNPVVNLFEDCLPTQAKQIPAMVVNMLIATSNHLCKTDGEHIFELGNGCIKQVNPKTQRCIRQIASKFQQYQRKESTPSAQDLCELFERLRPCLQSHLNTACGHPITRESYLDLFDVSMKVCKNYEKNEVEVLEIDAN